MISLDTNYLLRFLTNDIKSQAQAAKEVIEGSKEIYIPVIVIAETIYFLRNYYKVGKSAICEELSLLIRQPNIKTSDFVLLALDLYQAENISFYDTLLLGEVIEKNLVLKTFDQKLSKVFSKYSSSN